MRCTICVLVWVNQYALNNRHNFSELSSGTLTHWGRVTHICVGKITIIGSDNGLSPERRQAIIWTNVGILLIRPLGTNFSEILIGIQTFSFKKMYLKISSAKWRPFCLSLNVLTSHFLSVCCNSSWNFWWVGSWWLDLLRLCGAYGLLHHGL